MVPVCDDFSKKKEENIKKCSKHLTTLIQTQLILLFRAYIHHILSKHTRRLYQRKIISSDVRHKLRKDYEDEHP